MMLSSISIAHFLNEFEHSHQLLQESRSSKMDYIFGMIFCKNLLEKKPMIQNVTNMLLLLTLSLFSSLISPTCELTYFLITCLRFILIDIIYIICCIIILHRFKSILYSRFLKVTTRLTVHFNCHLCMYTGHFSVEPPFS